MELLNKFAENNNGKIIHIKNAVIGVDYYCPECKEKFILKKGNIRQHHFSHNNSSSNCTGTGEGYLHKAFKRMLLEILKEKMTDKLPMLIYWKCNICSMDHNCDILNGIIDVKEEYNLVECRPDIVLINQNNKVPIIIEIVDKHEPEKNVFDYCTKNQTVLIRIKLDSIEDLENINNKIQNPTNVFLFNQLHCPYILNYYMRQQQLKAQMIHNISVNSVNRGGPRIDQIQAVQDKKARQLKAIRYNYAKRSRKK